MPTIINWEECFTIDEARKISRIESKKNAKLFSKEVLKRQKKTLNINNLKHA